MHGHFKLFQDSSWEYVSCDHTFIFFLNQTDSLKKMSDTEVPVRTCSFTVYIYINNVGYMY